MLNQSFNSQSPNRESIYYICSFDDNKFHKEQWYTTMDRIKSESIIEELNLPDFPDLPHIHLGTCDELCNACPRGNTCSREVDDMIVGFSCVMVYSLPNEKKKHLAEIYEEWASSGTLALKQAIAECENTQRQEDLETLLNIILKWLVAYQRKWYTTTVLA